MAGSAGWFSCSLVALAFCSLPVSAQQPVPPGGPPPHPRYGARPPLAAGDWNLLSGIELTPDQATRVSAAFRARQQQLFLLFEKGRHPSQRSVMADSIAQLQRAQLNDMRAVLSSAQQLRFDANATALLARARQVKAAANTNR